VVVRKEGELSYNRSGSGKKRTCERNHQSRVSHPQRKKKKRTCTGEKKFGKKLGSVVCDWQLSMEEGGGRVIHVGREDMSSRKAGAYCAKTIVSRSDEIQLKSDY